MNSRPVKTVAFLTSALGFLVLMLLPAGPRGEPSVAPLLFVLLLIPAWFLLDDREVFPGYRKAWNWAVGVFLVVSSLDLLINQRPPQLTLIHQLGFLLLSKAFTNRQRRDYLIMLLLTLLMFFIVALLTRSLLLVPAIFLFLFLSVVLLILLQTVAEGEIVQRELKDAMNSGVVVPLPAAGFFEKGIVPDGRLWSKFRRPTLRIVLGCMALSGLIFYAWPRLRGEPFPYPPTGNLEERKQFILSGFSREVDLGSLTTLLEDPTPVMRVKLLQAYFPLQHLYMRGGSMDNFDGVRWFNTFHTPRSLKNFRPDPHTNRFEIRPPVHQQQVVEQEIEYINFPQRTFFTLPGLVAVKGVEGEILQEPGETYLSQSTVHQTFTAWSDLKPLRRRDHPPEDHEILSDKEMSCYLQWPRGLHLDQFRKFVDNTTPDTADRFIHARNLSAYLSQNFQYTTDLRGYTADNPIEQFLFKRHSGHCELFATSLVMLLRATDIPARLVVGFHGGRPLSGNEEYEIRQKDAHTWVEAWFEDRGWVSFDPTPAAPLPVYSNRLLFTALAGWFQGLSKKGHDLILDYDLQSQIGALNHTASYVSGVGKRVGDSRLMSLLVNRIEENFMTPPILSLAALLLALNAGAFFLYLRLRGLKPANAASSRQAGARRQSRRTSIEPFARLLHLLGLASKSRPVSHTPAEFVLCRAVVPQSARALVEEYIGSYYSWRFGDLLASQRNEVEQTMSRLLKELAVNLKISRATDSSLSTPRTGQENKS